MKDNFESSTFSLTASDGRQRYAIFFPTMNEKYQAVKVSRSLQMTLSEIAVRQLIVQFSIEKEYLKRTYQIETSFSGEK